MRFEQLRYLEAALRLGSLRKAAASVGVAQPSLTQQIKRLEEELDVVLLIRRSNGVTATEAARTLLPHVRLALQAEDALHQEASAIGGLHTGRLRLGTIPTASRLFVPQAVRMFRDRYPRVNFEVTEGGSGQVRDAILIGEVDLGIVARWADQDESSYELHTSDLLQGTHSVCVPVTHRLASRSSVNISDLDGEAFVVVEPGQFLRETFDRLAEVVNVTMTYQTTNSESARRIVEAGVGICFQVDFGGREQRAASVAVPFDGSWANVAISLVRRKHELPTPAMAMFAKLLSQEADSSY